MRGRPACALHDRRDLRRAAGGVGRARPRPRAALTAMRILLVSQMYPGPDDPDLGVFVAQGERALRERGHDVELAVLDRRAGGKARFLELRRRVRARRAARRRVGPLPRPRRAVRLGGGRAARRDRARARRPQHRRGAGCGASDPARRAPRGDGRRRVGVPAARARGACSGSTRQDRGRRLRCRSRALQGGRPRSRARVAGVRPRGLADRTEERRPARGCVRDGSAEAR